jgi:hypothetical protein
LFVISLFGIGLCLPSGHLADGVRPDIGKGIPKETPSPKGSKPNKTPQAGSINEKSDFPAITRGGTGTVTGLMNPLGLSYCMCRWRIDNAHCK